MSDISDHINEILIQISSDDGDVFLTDDLINCKIKNQKTYEKLLYIRDMIEFSIMLKLIITNFILLFQKQLINKGYDVKLLTNNLSSDFIPKHKKFIEQIWHWVVYLNLWWCIKFVSSIVVSFVNSKKSNQ